jgi:3-hydroxybutyryl-CoA dehydratase
MLRGDSFSQEFIIDREIYNGFIKLFRDENPLHTDISFAKKKGFTSTVMHGNILGGFISYFIGECLPIKNVIIHSQEIKYYNPVFLNDRLFFTAKVSDIFESVSVVMFDFLFENEHKQKIAMGKIQIGLI